VLDEAVKGLDSLAKSLYHARTIREQISKLKQIEAPLQVKTRKVFLIGVKSDGSPFMDDFQDFDGQDLTITLESDSICGGIITGNGREKFVAGAQAAVVSMTANSKNVSLKPSDEKTNWRWVFIYLDNSTPAAKRP
jgi:hypothetical protein